MLSLVTIVIIAVCVAALFSGVIDAIGMVVIALFMYVIAPVAALIAILYIIKFGF